MAEWNIYCETEKQIISVWSTVNDRPTFCPNDSSHIINPLNNYISRLARIRLSNGNITSTDSPTYVPVMNYITQGSHITHYDNDIPITVKIVASVDHGSYDFSFVIVPDEITLYESLGHTNTTPTIISIPIADFTNLPVDETSIDIRFRTSNTNSNIINAPTVTIRNISVYYAVHPG